MNTANIKVNFQPSDREKMLRNPNGTYRDSLQECSRWMYDNKCSCDVVFKVKNNENEEVPVLAHKFILMARSPVFRAMFCGPLAASGKYITIPDVHVEAFDEFLRFLYCDEAQLDNSNVFEVLYCAKKYMIALLELKCISYVRENLDVENVCSILDYSLQFDEQELERNCIKFIKACTLEVFKSQAFLESNINVVKKIIDQDVLNVQSECDILEALLAWAQKCCELKDFNPTPPNLRDALGPILHNVRMSSLEADALQKTIFTQGFLKPEEKEAIVQHVGGDCSAECRFIHAERFFLQQMHQFLIAENEYCSHSFLSGNVMTVDFTTDSSIRILSVDLLQVYMTVPIGVYYIIAVMQDGKCLTKVGVGKNHWPRVNDKNVHGRSYISVPFPTPAEVNSGKFTIEMLVKSGNNFVTVATATPRSKPSSLSGVTLTAVSENATCLRSFGYAIGL